MRIVRPSGLNATAPDRARMLQGLAEGPAGGGVPQPRRLVLAPGEDRLAIGAERHERRQRPHAQGRADGPAGGGVPQRAVLSLYPVRMVRPSGLNATETQVAPRHAAVGRSAGRWRRPTAAPAPMLAAGEDRLAVGAERHGQDRV